MLVLWEPVRRENRFQNLSSKKCPLVNAAGRAPKSINPRQIHYISDQQLNFITSTAHRINSFVEKLAVHGFITEG